MSTDPRTETPPTSADELFEHYSDILLASALVLHSWQEGQKAGQRAKTAVGPEQREAAQQEVWLAASVLNTSLRTLEAAWMRELR